MYKTFVGYQSDTNGLDERVNEYLAQLDKQKKRHTEQWLFVAGNNGGSALILCVVYTPNL